MKILLTGSNGFLGNILKHELENKYFLQTLSRTFSDYNIDLSKNNNIRFNDKFEIVIHAAGKAHILPNNELERKSFYEVNLVGTLNLLKGLEASGLPKNFVFISSVSVYGYNQGVLLNENTPLLARDAYGKSKIEAEEIIINWCNKYNIRYTILRLPLIIGKNAPGNLNAMKEAIKLGYYFNIDGGRAKKSMVLGSDIAKHIISSSKIGGIYNLTDGIHPTFNEISKIISIKLDKNPPFNLPKFIAIIFAKIGDIIGDKFPINSLKFNKITSTLTFDDTKARNAFNWNPNSVLDNFII